MRSLRRFILIVVLAIATQAFSGTATKDSVVVDSLGKELGLVVGFDDSLRWPVIRMTINKFTFFIRVITIGDDINHDFGFSAGTHPDGSADSLYFESNDCTGTPYLISNNPTRVTPLIAISAPGNTVYRSEGPEISITIDSILRGRQELTCDVDQIPQVIPAFRAIPVANLDTLFTPPFTIK
jgi:hypothetical protein